MSGSYQLCGVRDWVQVKQRVSPWVSPWVAYHGLCSMCYIPSLYNKSKNRFQLIFFIKQNQSESPVLFRMNRLFSLSICPLRQQVHPHYSHQYILLDFSRALCSANFTFSIQGVTEAQFPKITSPLLFFPVIITTPHRQFRTRQGKALSMNHYHCSTETHVQERLVDKETHHLSALALQSCPPPLWPCSTSQISEAPEKPSSRPTVQLSPTFPVVTHVQHHSEGRKRVPTHLSARELD